VPAPPADVIAGRTKAMPLYEYELCEGECVVCGGRFTLRRPVNARPLTQCPACKKPVRRVISPFTTPKLTKPLSISDAKKAGFTVLKRVGKGEYEKQ
jgi:putative FmdB family regulatory protein